MLKFGSIRGGYAWGRNKIDGRAVYTTDDKLWRIKVTKYDKRSKQRGGDIIVWSVPSNDDLESVHFIERPDEWSPAYMQMLSDREWVFYDPLYCKTSKYMAMPHFIIRRRVLKAYEKKLGIDTQRTDLTEVARRGEKRVLWRRGGVPLAVLNTTTPS